MTTLDEMATYYGQLFSECFSRTTKIFKKFHDEREKIRTANPTWLAARVGHTDRAVDARIGAFTKQVNVLLTSQVILLLYVKSLCEKDWILKNIDSEYSSRPELMEKQYEAVFAFVARHCFNALFINFESSVRIFMNALDATGGAASEKFQHLYTRLFKEVGLSKRQERIAAMEFMSVIRNSNHNNNFYYPPSKDRSTKHVLRFWKYRLVKEVPVPPIRRGDKKDFTYKGKTYTCVVGETMNFMTYPLIMDFAEDILEILVEVVSHPKISKKNEVIEEEFPSNS